MANGRGDLHVRRCIEQDGLKVSKSPWGPDDEIGRLNWITPETNRAILEHLDGCHVFDLNVEYFIGMPSWVAAGDPPLRDLDDAHAAGLDQRQPLGRRQPTVHEKYSYCGDSIHMYTHCGTHIDTLNHLGFYGKFWNGWTADKDLGSRIWNKGGLDKYPPIIARGVLLDVAGLHGVDCLPDGYAITPEDLQNAAPEQGVEIRAEERRARPHRPHDRLAGLRRLPASTRPGIGLPAAKWLCEEAGAMCIAGDSIALEVLPSEEPDVFLPVHAYMFATAGAQIIEVVEHGGDRGREAVRVRVPRLPAQAARRDRRADALLRGAAEVGAASASSGPVRVGWSVG